MAPGTWNAPEENWTVASASGVAYCSRSQASNGTSETDAPAVLNLEHDK